MIIADSVNQNGIGQNGVTVNAYKASRFSGTPQLGESPPAGGPDATSTTGTNSGSEGAFQITTPTDEAYYVSATINGIIGWMGPYPEQGAAIDITAADITVSAPGDAQAAGAVGLAADAGHRHGREALSGPVVVPPSGDASGATDTTNIQAALNANKDVALFDNSAYYLNANVSLTITYQTLTIPSLTTVHLTASAASVTIPATVKEGRILGGGTIDGGAVANYGIQMADNGLGQHELHIIVQNCQGSPGKGIYQGYGNHSVLYYRCRTPNNNIGVHQNYTTQLTNHIACDYHGNLTQNVLFGDNVHTVGLTTMVGCDTERGNSGTGGNVVGMYVQGVSPLILIGHYSESHTTAGSHDIEVAGAQYSTIRCVGGTFNGNAVANYAVVMSASVSCDLDFDNTNFTGYATGWLDDTTAANKLSVTTDACNLNGTPTPRRQTALASTGSSGFAKQNGTPVIATWTAPNDGVLHYADVSYLVNVATAETGGQVQVQLQNTTPATVATKTIDAGGNGTGYALPTAYAAKFSVPPGYTFRLIQSTALTVGASTVYASIVGA